jgi:15-cis-phytoene synthase
MDGSAASVGTMMLPILQTPQRAAAPAAPSGSAAPSATVAGAREPARQLGFAFQLTNFIRDVAEDLDRGRIYLPIEDLDRFGVSPDDLSADRAAGVASPAVRDLIAYEIGRARAHYALAAPGVAMLVPSSQPCVRAAYRLYGEILDEVERAGCDVFGRRAVVPGRRRLVVAVESVLGARRLVAEQKG